MSGSPTQRAFVVKISADAGPTRVVGQVEHVTSGTSARFEAIEQLGAFISDILRLELEAADARWREAE